MYGQWAENGVYKLTKCAKELTDRHSRVSHRLANYLVSAFAVRLPHRASTPLQRLQELQCAIKHKVIISSSG